MRPVATAVLTVLATAAAVGVGTIAGATDRASAPAVVTLDPNAPLLDTGSIDTVVIPPAQGEGS